MGHSIPWRVWSTRAPFGLVILLLGACEGSRDPLQPQARDATALFQHTAAAAAVTLAGSFQSELGCPGDWQPECAATHLVYDAADDVWQATFDVPAGSWEYKAPLNDSWSENYGRFAESDGSNIPLVLASPSAVKFYYSHQTHWVTSSRNAVIATVPGSFQSELGCPGDWQPDCLRSWLQDPEEDGVYTFTTSSLPAGSYEAKVAINESWDENYGQGGVQNGANIPFTVTAFGAPVTFTYDATTHVLTITAGTVNQPVLVVNSPASIAGNYVVGTAFFGPPLTPEGTTGDVVQGLDLANAAGPTVFDACSPLTNAAEVAGKIALVDRGTCTFVTKVGNAQAAGAIAVIVVNNASGPPPGMGGSDPTITIPSVSISLADGNLIKSQLAPGPVNATLRGPAADEEPPTLAVPPDMTVEATSSAGAVVTYSVTATDNVDPDPAVSCEPPSGATFAIGSTVVTCVATDAAGNTATASFVVTVVDTTPPTLILPGDLIVNATSPSGAFVSYVVNASDAVSVPSVSCTPASGSLFEIGTHTVSCTATDASGNSTTASFVVTVQGAEEQITDLEDAVTGLDLQEGTETSLQQKLAAAVASLADGQREASCGQLEALINQVNAQIGKKITAEDAAVLIADAERIRAVLGC